MSQYQKLIDHILSKKEADIIETKLDKSDLSILINKDKLVPFLKWLKSDKKCQFHMLVSICGADYPARADRFEIVYNLMSLSLNQRILVKVRVEEDEFLTSIISLYKCANWYEREIYDMFGVMFEYHPDLRRILTDYTFEGYPLRKDFPLTGYKEIKYNHNDRKVSYEKVELQQEFRNFDFLTPWSGPDYVLPGDEKATKNDK